MTKQIWTKVEAGQYETLIDGVKITVWRREPGCWTFEANGVPADGSGTSAAQVKAIALVWAAFNLTEGKHPVVIVDMYLGRRNVAFLANSSERTTRLWAEKMERRAQFLAAREAAEQPAPAPTTAQEYRGVAITVQAIPVVGGHTLYRATAGHRSAICTRDSEREARIGAVQAIDVAHDCMPERIALWINDTAHWRASQDHTLPAQEMLTRCRAQVERVAQVRQDIEALTAIRERVIARLETRAPAPNDALRGALHNASYNIALAIKSLDGERDLIVNGKG
jgi:hypothetical protein